VPGDHGKRQVVDGERGQRADLHGEQRDGQGFGPPGEERDRDEHRRRRRGGHERMPPEGPPVLGERREDTGEAACVACDAPVLHRGCERGERR
jgi:hypothetical protein